MGRQQAAFSEFAPRGDAADRHAGGRVWARLSHKGLAWAAVPQVARDEAENATTSQD
jgi:hypothetical protein